MTGPSGPQIPEGVRLTRTGATFAVHDRGVLVGYLFPNTANHQRWDAFITHHGITVRGLGTRKAAIQTVLDNTPQGA